MITATRLPGGDLPEGAPRPARQGPCRQPRARARVGAVLLAAGLWLDPAHAWGSLGHRVTGAIAEQCLSPATAAAVHELLGTEDLAEASTWADFMRSSDDPFWRAAGPLHYVTVPPGARYADVAPPPQGDAVTALTRFRRELRDPATPRSERVRALRFAVHIVGDLHQPLHVGNGRDRGGNDYHVLFFDEPTNLHRLWDTLLPAREGLSFSEWARWLARRLTPGQVAAWYDADPHVWIGESVRLRERLYPAAGASLDWDYVYRHRDDVRRRLTQAGVRIAAWLDETFDARRDVQATPPATCMAAE